MQRKNHQRVFIIALICSLTFAICISFFKPGEEPTIIEEKDDVEQKVLPVITSYKYKFGESTDSLFTINDKVKKNETFLQILNRHNVSGEDAVKIINKSKSVYNFKNIKSGTAFTVYKSKDTASRAKYIVYEPSIKETIILKIEDSVSVIKKEKEIKVNQKSIGGVINVSLYESLVEKNAPVQLVYELSRLFSTKVDFFKINKGDEFKIIYDEVTLEGNPIGIEKIYSASFEHDNKTYYAVNYSVNGKEEFYDEAGQSMKKGFLKAPLKFFRITSRFSKKRFHPVQKIFKAHLGTDYAAPTGTPILSVGNGVVTEAKFGKFNGNYVKIKHNGTYTTQYLHMSRIAKGIKSGTKVSQGQVIGYVGSTGLSSGPHVCFRFWKDGKQVDPSGVKSTAVESLDKKNLKEFTKVKNEQIKNLSRISI